MDDGDVIVTKVLEGEVGDDAHHELCVAGPVGKAPLCELLCHCVVQRDGCGVEHHVWHQSTNDKKERGEEGERERTTKEKDESTGGWGGQTGETTSIR